MKFLPVLETMVSGLFCLVRPGSSAAQSWTQTTAPSNHWTSLASAADGTYLIGSSSSEGDGLVYVSTNAGGSWVPAGVPAQDWASVAASADGATLFCGVKYYGPGSLWKSADAGASWGLTTATLSNGCAAVACSANGSNIVAAVPAGGHYAGWLFSSTNGGGSWTAADPGFDLFSSVTSSADGGFWIAVSEMFRSYTSDDLGQTWSGTNNPNGTEFWSVASSADGRKLVAATTTSIYLSADGGTSWSTSSAPNAAWLAVASSADGTSLLAVAYGLPPYRSTDSGLHWEPTSGPATNWQAVASSADGCRLAGAVNGGGIYTVQFTPRPVLNTRNLGTTLLLSWIVPSQKFVVQQSPDLANWSSVPETESLNYTNLHYQVTLNVSNGPAFYRLAPEQAP